MTMIKNSKNSVNYLRVNIYPTLFGGFLIQREYGIMYKTKPSNIIKEYASNYKEALILTLERIVSSTDVGYLKAS